MPGSTSVEPSKAKATADSTSAANGIFVRPVAVAGIFRPADDKPPALPEKRRFSALVGDLRPLSTSNTVSNDDFNRRRQSWDTRNKEPVPFGQALLRKTQRNSITPSVPVKEEPETNGSCHEDASRSEKSSIPVPEGKKSDVTVPKTDSPTTNVSAEPPTDRDKRASGDVSEKTAPELATKSVTESVSNQSKIKSDQNSSKSQAKQDKSITNLNGIPETKSANVIETPTPKVGDKRDVPTDNAKQVKRVFGLIKRDSKPECAQKPENILVKSDTKSAGKSSKTDVKDNAVEKIPQQEISNKGSIDALDSKSKIKIYGLSRRSAVNDAKGKETEVNQANVNVINNKCDDKVPNKTLETNSIKCSANIKTQNDVHSSKTPVNDSEKNLSENLSPSQTSVFKSSDSQVVEKTKILVRNSETQKAPSPPKDFRTVRRTSDVIAAKIQNIFSNISTPEKTTPIPLKKNKATDKSISNSDAVSNSVAKLSSGAKSETQNAEKNSENKIVNKTDCKLPTDDKSSDVKVSTKKAAVAESNVKTSSSLSENANKGESKSKPSQPTADAQSLKKENKFASEYKGILQTCESLTSGVQTKPVPAKADSKTEPLIDAVPAKVPDKKIPNTGGKMPIKKPDQNCLDTTASLTAANQVDCKFSDPTTPLNAQAVMSSKGLILKTSNHSTVSSCANNLQSVFSSTYSANSTSFSSANKKEYKIVSKTLESTTAQTSSVKTGVSQHFATVTGIKATLQSSTGQSEKVESVSDANNVPNSKIEVAKITQSTAPGIVPTVNVLFRTKSPQSSATKEENRKKVVVETYTINSSVPCSVITASKVPENISVQPTPNTNVSVKESLQTVDNIKKSANSTKTHSIVNLKNEELVSVQLGASETSANMSPNTVKDDVKSSVSNAKTESSPNGVQNLPTQEKSAFCSDKTKLSSTSSSVSDSKIPSPSNAVYNMYSKSFQFENVNGTGAIPKYSPSKIETVLDKSSVVETKTSVLDIGDWNKRFQRMESEPPRVPLRRRAQRESLPPALPTRTQFGSLKRMEDYTKYLPRSPSFHNSLPQRYSYTEMLSKVCSMGVLPCAEPSVSKSFSSSSSQVSELWSELSEEQSTATHTSEMLEAETTERMRLEKEVQELQNRYSQVQLRSDKMEMEMMEARVYRTPELNGDLSEDEDPEGNSSLYKQKYERAVRDMEIMKRRIQQQHEEELEQKAMLKKASDKKLAEALEDVEEERQVANQWKRKAQKLGSELQDLRLMLEEQMARNGELEKKQRRFDAELSAAQEEIKKERLMREKFSREKDQAMHEKYSLEQDLQSSKIDVDNLHEKIIQLNRELDELTLSSKGEEEVTQLKRAKQELERKNRDQEEELEELAAQVGMLEQAKLRLEMSLEKVRQEHRREASVREEEIEEIRASFSKKIKNLEAQLESEQDERHQLVKQKHELERRLYEIAEQPPPHDPEIERRLRRDLKRTKALLRDAQSMLEHTREGQSGKTVIRQLKNQLEDSEFAKAAAVKARQAVETELHDCQIQLEEATRGKNEAESRCLQLSREKSAIQTQLEEAEEEMAEVMKKYKAVVAQMSIDQKALSEQIQQIADLEAEKQMLKDQLSEVSHKFEHLAGQSEDTHKVHRLDGKVRDLESKLELEQTTRSRLEHQIARLKEQNDRLREECDALRNKELQAQEGVRRLQRQVRDLREDYAGLQQKEAEAYRKQHELEMALENTETDLQVTKNDLRLACQRIQDLQNALEDDLDSGTDVPDDSGSDSDESFEMAMLRTSSVTPTQRCDSAASNYSYTSAEGIRSRTSSFTQELSAFSSRNDDAEKEINGFSGVNSSSHLLDVDHDETV